MFIYLHVYNENKLKYIIPTCDFLIRTEINF